MKTIRLNRAELVWQYRSTAWEEEDYKKLLDYLKTFKDKEDEDDFAKNNARLHDFLSQFTWDQVCDWCENYDPNEPQFEYENNYYGEGEIWRHSETVSEIIKDYIREENYNSDIEDEEYADDYDEDWYYREDKENEF